MKFSLYLISLITICILPNTFVQGCSKVPGPASCSYFAGIQDWCGKPDIPVSDLPENCSTFVYCDIRSTPNFTMYFGTPKIKNDKYIKNLLSSGKCVFLYFGREDEYEWMNALSPNSKDGGVNAKTEMSNLNSFIGSYKTIAGIIIEGLILSPDNPGDPCLTDNFKIYLEEMKKCFPNYGIGFEIMGYALVDLYNQTNPPPYLNFSALDSHIDFYVIDVEYANDCTEDYKVGGTLPVNGNDYYTLEKTNCYVEKLGIPPNKTYWSFVAGPSSTKYSSCNTTYGKVCLAPTLDGFCADNTKSFYDKGAFAKENGVGFFALDLDLRDDSHGCCGCKNGPFPAFHSMLAGFNSDPVPPNCTLFDKPS